MAQATTRITTKPGGYVVIRSEASGYLNLNAGTYAANSAGETNQSMVISHIMWSSSGTARWTVKRGANTMAELNYSGNWDLQSAGMPLEVNSFEKSANLVFTKSAGNGTIVIKLHKTSGE
jgi:hypothetical protein